MSGSAGPASNSNNEEDDDDTGCCGPVKSRFQRLLVSLCLMIVTAIIWVTGTQLTRETYTANSFEAPFLVMYFWSSWLLLVYPINILVRRIWKRDAYFPLLEFSPSHLMKLNDINIEEQIYTARLNKGNKTNSTVKGQDVISETKETHSDSTQHEPPQKLEVKSGAQERTHLRIFSSDHEHAILRYLGLSLLFCVLWSVTNYTYIRALDPRLLDTSEVATLYATHYNFVYTLSWIVLCEKFVALRILAMISSITGVVLFAYADGFGSSSMWGVILAVGSSATVSVFKVLFKKLLHVLDCGKLSFFISLIGFCCVLCMWPIALTLCLTRLETVSMSQVPWKYLIGSTSLMTGLQLLLFYTQNMKMFSLFTALGFAVGIPLCAVTDVLWRNKEFNGMKIAAIAMSVIGLFLVLLPDQCPDGLFSFNSVNLCWRFKSADTVHTQPEILSRGGRMQRNVRRM